MIQSGVRRAALARSSVRTKTDLKFISKLRLIKASRACRSVGNGRLVCASVLYECACVSSSANWRGSLHFISASIWQQARKAWLKLQRKCCNGRAHDDYDEETLLNCKARADIAKRATIQRLCGFAKISLVARKTDLDHHSLSEESRQRRLRRRRRRR